MSGPWDDYKPKTAAPAPTAASAQPWADFQSAPPEDATGGLEVSVTGGRNPKRGEVPEEDFQRFLKAGYTEGPDGILVPPKPPETSMGGAALAGLKSGALLGGDDEITGFGGAVGNFLGRHPSVGDPLAYLLSGGNSAMHFDPGTGKGFMADLEQERQAAQGYKDAAWDQHPYAYAAGYVPGMAASMVLPGGRAVQGASYGKNALRLAGTGALYGGISGALNADPGDRVRGGATGAAVGAAVAPFIPPLTRVVGGLVNRVGEATGINAALRGSGNALNSGWDALFRRANQDPVRMADEAARLRASGVDPRPVDVVDEAGRRVLRTAAQRPTPASEDLARGADATYIDAQDRVAGQVRRVMGTAPETSRQVADRIASEREDFATPAFDAARNDPVPVTGDIAAALSTTEGQRALVAARSLMLPPERAQVDRVLSAARAANNIDPRLPQAVADKLRQQIFNGAGLNVDVADKFARSLLGRARTANPGLARVATDLGNSVRDAARAASPAYGNALDEYAARSRVGDAAGGVGRFENTDFLKTAPDQYRDTLATADPVAPQTSDNAVLPSEREALQLRARDDAVAAATRSPASAIATGKALAVGSQQGERNLALLGPRRAGLLRDAAQAEVDRVRNTAFIDPRTGSQTASRGEDSLGHELISLVPNAMSGGKWHVVKEVGRWLRGNNLRGIDAERLTRDALDPSRTDDAIAYLTRKGASQTQARTLVRSILATGAARGAGAAQASTPPDPNQ